MPSIGHRTSPADFFLTLLPFLFHGGFINPLLSPLLPVPYQIAFLREELLGKYYPRYFLNNLVTRFIEVGEMLV